MRRWRNHWRRRSSAACGCAVSISRAQKFFGRLWVRGLDITGADDVAEEAKGLGIDVPALLRDIGTSHAKDTLKQQVDAAIQVGVFGVPYFVVDGEPIWGVDRMWM